jgi:RhoGEF domain
MSKSGNLAALAAIFKPGDPPLLYYAEDLPYLPRILIFYWPVQAIGGSLASTSRIRTTILSAAGFKSFAAFSVSPSSAYYSAVHKLPDDKQRDDVYRGIAFSLCRYFSEVPTEVKNAINEENVQHGMGLKWGQTHAAEITCRLSRVVNAEEVIDSLRPFQKDRPSSPPVPVRPLASIRKTRPSFLPQEVNPSSSRLGQFSTPSRRIPSGQARRTPSSSTPGAKSSLQTQSQKHSAEQLESLRFKMCEFVDTEDRYISRLQQLIELVTTQSRTPKSISSKHSTAKGQNAVNAMLQFPALLDQIRELNLAFLEDLESSLQNTEDAAMAWLQETPPPNQSSTKDVVGAYAFAKVLLNHFPKFPMPYREYLDLHSQISSNLDLFLKEGTSSIQQIPSLLMEPAQRISRYSLYIDAMIPHLPPTSTITIRTFEKARKIIAEICEMEPAASTILDGLRIEHEGRRRGALSPTKLLSTLTRSNGSIREAPPITARETPRLLPGLSRGFSRRSKSRLVLAEQNIDQANNVQPLEKRPVSSGAASVLSMGKRPATTGSSTSGGESLANSVLVTENGNRSVNVTELAEQYRVLEQETYRLLQENAELKRLLRYCRCQR